MKKPLHSMQLCDLALHMLAACHVELRPGSTAEEFHLKTMALVKRYDDPSIVDPVEIVMQFVSDELRAKGAEWIATYPPGPMLISAAYCVRAQISFRGGFSELAWSNTAQAMFWCSVASASKRIDAIILEATKGARADGEAQANSNKGRLGAEKRSQAYEPLREIAREHVRRPDVKWSSRSHAVRAVMRELQRFCEDKVVVGEVHLAPPISATVDKWLREMPDAASLFPSKKAAK